jgi:hypothetical protein
MNSLEILDRWRQQARDYQLYRAERTTRDRNADIEAGVYAVYGDYDADIEADVVALHNGEIEADNSAGTWNLYIGSDNETGTIDHRKMRRVLDEFHVGYTIAYTVGAWEGRSESSVIVTLTGTESRVRATAQSVRLALKQQAVGIVRIGDDMVFV